MSDRALDVPAILGSTGALWLPRHELRRMRIGVVDAAGTATGSCAIPAETALLGHTDCLQGLVRSKQHLTSNWVPLTVLP